jgi:hypothetical protein
MGGRVYAVPPPNLFFGSILAVAKGEDSTLTGIAAPRAKALPHPCR